MSPDRAKQDGARNYAKEHKKSVRAIHDLFNRLEWFPSVDAPFPIKSSDLGNGPLRELISDDCDLAVRLARPVEKDIFKTASVEMETQEGATYSMKLTEGQGVYPTIFTSLYIKHGDIQGEERTFTNLQRIQMAVEVVRLARSSYVAS